MCKTCEKVFLDSCCLSKQLNEEKLFWEYSKKLQNSAPKKWEYNGKIPSIKETPMDKPE